MLEHKDIKGTVEFDQESKMFFGKLVGINGLVMYEAENAEDFQNNFISAVEDYIQTCEENEMPVKKEYKGVFNVRTSPETHERLVMICIEKNVKLNAIVNQALEMYLTNDNITHGYLEVGNYAPSQYAYTEIRPGVHSYAQKDSDIIIPRHFLYHLKSRKEKLSHFISGQKGKLSREKISKSFPRPKEENKK